MKLLYISSANPLVKSGYYNAVTDRLSELRKDNDITLEALNYSQHKTSSPFSINIHKPWFLFQKGPIKYLENLYLYNRIIRALKKVKPDVVHVHWCYPIGYCAVKACKALDIPCVLTSHGSDIHSNPLKSRYIYSKTTWTLSNVSSNIFVSSALQEQAHKICKSLSASYTIPNAIDTRKIDSITNIPKGKTDNKTREILYIGNLNTTKGADLLPEIFSKLKETFAPEKLNFTIAGNGPLYDTIKNELTHKKIAANMLGHVSRDNSLQLIYSSDLVVIPSRHEGFGIVALEAFLAKTPCVGFKIPGFDNVFQGNENLLVKLLSLDDFVSKSVSILNKNEIINYSRYRTDYDISNTIKNEIKIYHMLTNQPQ